MFGFMLDESEGTDPGAGHLPHLPPEVGVARAARGGGGAPFHRERYEAAHKKRTGSRPSLVTHNGDRVTFRLAA